MTQSPVPSLPRHGGDLAWAAERYGTPTDGWLDLSTGINPAPYPVPPSLDGDLARLPDPRALADLLEAARAAYELNPAAAIAATPGTEIAIRLLPLVAPPGPVAILGPTYGSHAEAWRRAGRPVREVESPDALPADARIVVLANPNNPDGRVLSVPALTSLAHRLADAGGLLIVDEAFADLAPEASFAPRLGGIPALVLRSFGKFYGLAGLRLGFVAGQPDTVAALAALLGDWPVSGPALAIGRTALRDRNWQSETRRKLAARTADLRALLRRHGLAVAGGTDLFVLVAADEAAAVHKGLARHGIWTRIFPLRPRWLRIGLPRGAEEFARLDQALAEVRSPTTG